MRKLIFIFLLLILISNNKYTYAIVKPKLWENQWDMQIVTNNGLSYEKYSGSKNVTVALIDSGINTTHHDLINNIDKNSINLVPKGGIDGTEKYETGHLNQIEDLTGHGTLVGGQIAANGYMKGIAPNINLKIYRAFSGKGISNTKIITKAIKMAADDDVDVINLSLGEYLVKGVKYKDNKINKNDLRDIEEYRRAISYANKKGAIIVSSYGNDSINTDDKNMFKNTYLNLFGKKIDSIKGTIIDTPASLDGVIGVSSINRDMEISNFSNFSKDVDIYAPGGDDYLFNHHSYDDWINSGMQTKEQVMSTSVNGYYMYSYGNSLATPKVSGTLALIIDKYGYKNKPKKTIKHFNKFAYDLKYEKIHKSYIKTLNTYKAISSKEE